MSRPKKLRSEFIRCYTAVPKRTEEDENGIILEYIKGRKTHFSQVFCTKKEAMNPVLYDSRHFPEIEFLRLVRIDTYRTVLVGSD